MQNQQPVNPSNQGTRFLYMVSTVNSPMCALCLRYSSESNPDNSFLANYSAKLIWAAIHGVNAIGIFVVGHMLLRPNTRLTQLPITNITVTNTSHLVDAGTTGIANLAESSPSFLNMVFDQVANASPETIALASAAILAASGLVYAAGDDIKQSVASSVTSLTESGYSLFKKAAEFAGYSSMPAKVSSLTV
jgi:hypothetical protein